MRAPRRAWTVFPAPPPTTGSCLHPSSCLAQHVPVHGPAGKLRPQQRPVLRGVLPVWYVPSTPAGGVEGERVGEHQELAALRPGSEPWPACAEEPCCRSHPSAAPPCAGYYTDNRGNCLPVRGGRAGCREGVVAGAVALCPGRAATNQSTWFMCAPHIDAAVPEGVHRLPSVRNAARLLRRLLHWLQVWLFPGERPVCARQPGALLETRGVWVGWVSTAAGAGVRARLPACSPCGSHHPVASEPVRPAWPAVLLQCPNGCATCQGQTCLSCISPLRLFNGRCIISLPVRTLVGAMAAGPLAAPQQCARIVPRASARSRRFSPTRLTSAAAPPIAPLTLQCPSGCTYCSVDGKWCTSCRPALVLRSGKCVSPSQVRRAPGTGGGPGASRGHLACCEPREHAHPPPQCPAGCATCNGAVCTACSYGERATAGWGLGAAHVHILWQGAGTGCRCCCELPVHCRRLFPLASGRRHLRDVQYSSARLRALPAVRPGRSRQALLQQRHQVHGLHSRMDALGGRPPAVQARQLSWPADPPRRACCSGAAARGLLPSSYYLLTACLCEPTLTTRTLHAAPPSTPRFALALTRLHT